MVKNTTYPQMVRSTRLAVHSRCGFFTAGHHAAIPIIGSIKKGPRERERSEEREIG